MGLSRLILLLLLLASAAYSQEVRSHSLTVSIKLAPIPQWLQSKFAGKTIKDSGVAPFGTGAKDVWVVCYQETKTKMAFGELWDQANQKRPHRLLRATLNSPSAHPSSIGLFWVFPASRSGPAVTTLFGSRQRIYTFEQGWNTGKPIVQDIEYIPGYSRANPFDFDTVDERGITRGEAWVDYHTDNQDDNPGYFATLWWHQGKGWSGIQPKS